MTKTRSRKRRIGIRDWLGWFTYRGTCRLLADSEEDVTRLRQGGRFEINLPRDVYLGDMLRVKVPDPELGGSFEPVTVVEMLGAAINLVGELVNPGDHLKPSVVEQIREGLADCTERTPDGRLQLRFSHEDDDHRHHLRQSPRPRTTGNIGRVRHLQPEPRNGPRVIFDKACG